MPTVVGKLKTSSVAGKASRAVSGSFRVECEGQKYLVTKNYVERIGHVHIEVTEFGVRKALTAQCGAGIEVHSPFQMLKIMDRPHTTYSESAFTNNNRASLS